MFQGGQQHWHEEAIMLAHNRTQLKTCFKLFICGIFHLIFLGRGWELKLHKVKPQMRVALVPMHCA